MNAEDLKNVEKAKKERDALTRPPYKNWKMRIMRNGLIRDVLVEFPAAVSEEQMRLWWGTGAHTAHVVQRVLMSATEEETWFHYRCEYNVSRERAVITAEIRARKHPTHYLFLDEADWPPDEEFLS